MYQPVPAPAPDPDERPPSVTRGAIAIGITCLGLLVSTFAAVLSFTYTPPETDSATDSGAGPFLTGYIGWGFLSVVLLMLGAVMTLRRVNGGRILIWIVGGMSVFTLLGCAGAGVLVEALGTNEDDRATTYPPSWMFYLAIAGSVIGLVAVIMAIVFYGRRESGRWFKPPPQQFSYTAPQPPPPYRPY